MIGLTDMDSMDDNIQPPENEHELMKFKDWYEHVLKHILKIPNSVTFLSTIMHEDNLYKHLEILGKPYTGFGYHTNNANIIEIVVPNTCKGGGYRTLYLALNDAWSQRRRQNPCLN